MALISFGTVKKKIFFPIVSIIISYVLFNVEYFSGYFFDFRKNNSPKLYSLYFSFSFLGCFIFGGILLFISYMNSRGEAKNLEKKKLKELKKKKESGKRKANRLPSLIYDEESSKIRIHLQYFIISAFLELLANFSYSSVVFDFMDIEAKILYSAFEIVFIKIISRVVFKFHFYRHQIFSMILLVLILFATIMMRETFLMKNVKGQLKLYDDDFQMYLKITSTKKMESGFVNYLYFTFTSIGILSRSFSICYDKWLIIDKLCHLYKLLFFKGLFGFIPAFSIQLILYYAIGENLNTDNISDENNGISLKNLYKRLSFPFSSFVSNKDININIIVIILFFILVGIYYIFTIIVINEFNTEFIGLVSVSSATLVLFTIQLINAFMAKRIHMAITVSLIHLFFFVCILIPSLILCEILVLNFCKCDKNISSNIEKRANLEVSIALQLYNSEDDEDDSKNRTFGSEDFSNRSID